MNQPVTVPTRPLNTGGQIPLIGLGTWPMDDAQAAAAVRSGLQLGYRLLDTAAKYGNEVGVGRGIRDSGIPRSEVVVTTKLRGADHGYDSTKTALHASLDRLGLDYVDIYLIHWPLPRLAKFVESYQAMLAMRGEGLIRSVGVSNFTKAHIGRLDRETGVLPAVNQIQLSPALPRAALHTYLERHGIVTQSYSPLGREEGAHRAPVVRELAQRYGRTPEQVILRWHVQQDLVAIPKSGDQERQRANLAVFDFELSPEDMSRLRALDQGESAAVDPDRHEEF
ncbi:MAG TPA: aldo/keto reductase [Pseudonocardiaceae bacterium]|nr:aldo/keto reductase [Pseudonocardiaceae bacterium]